MAPHEYHRDAREAANNSSTYLAGLHLKSEALEDGVSCHFLIIEALTRSNSFSISSSEAQDRDVDVASRAPVSA